MLSLPIPIIAGNFETFHKNMQKKNKAEKAKKQLEEDKAEENMSNQTKTRTNNNTIKNRKSMFPPSPDPHC